MTPASELNHLAGKWIVWKKDESRPVVNLDGVVTGYTIGPRWRYGQISKRTKTMLHTMRYDRVLVSDAYVVAELDWPRWEFGAYKVLDQGEFDELMTRCQP